MINQRLACVVFAAGFALGAGFDNIQSIQVEREELDKATVCVNKSVTIYIFWKQYIFLSLAHYIA